MKQKWPIIITGIIFIAALIIGLVYAISSKKVAEEENKEVTEINLQEVAVNIIENSDFKEMATADITMEELNALFQVNTDNVKKVVGQFPMMSVHASMFVIVEAKDGKVDEVKSELNEYAKLYEEMWSTYLPEQYDLVRAREFGNKGNYVYLIIAENAKELKDLIK